MSSAPKPRPKYYDLNLAHLPPPGLVSILHRVTGLALFFPVLPLLLYAMQQTLASEAGWAHWKDVLSRPGVKLILLVALWFYAHHFWAGIRYLLLDLHLGIGKAPSKTSAVVVLVLGLLTVAIAGWCVW
jgi:succinate dehydrogenase / fumarate reductase cytochrome b subunit